MTSRHRFVVTLVVALGMPFWALSLSSLLASDKSDTSPLVPTEVSEGKVKKDQAAAIRAIEVDRDSELVALADEMAHADGVERIALANKKLAIKSRSQQAIDAIAPPEALPNLLHATSVTTRPPTQANMNPIEARRKRMLAEADSQIERDRKSLALLKAGASDRQSFVKEIQRLNKEKNIIAGMSEKEIQNIIDEELENIRNNEREARAAAQNRFRGRGNNAPGTELDSPGSSDSSNASGKHNRACPQCGGLGRIGHTDAGRFNKVMSGDSGPIRDCPQCNGTGRVE